MRYWLFKSEPTAFDLEALQRCPKQTTAWDGVRNYQVRNLLRDVIKTGDLAFFYYSNCKVPGIAGIIQVVSHGYPDATAWDPTAKHYDPTSSPEEPRWYMVDVCFVKQFDHLISLQTLKTTPVLNKMKVTEPGSRLSITPVTVDEWQLVLALDKSHRD